ncbi:MAG TPA: hypothetical protein PK359_20730, partial [Burkholderiaceae bacterium]|nr:hypothetical protein [Burkholderiaceae bacterium]
MSTSSDAGRRLSEAAAQVSSMRRAIAADPSLRQWAQAVKHWQAARLAVTHADLLAAPGTRAAARFFLDDLYGAKDFSRRDTELMRLVPTMARLLPERALATVADAVELDALSERFDEAMARLLRRTSEREIAEADYAKAFRQASTQAQREHQLDLVMRIGHSLEGLVRHPLIGRLLGAMQAPARLAGLQEMHDFLARGFGAFKGMPSSSVFLGQIDRRERAIMARIFA